ncbi:hypothetical protein MXD61_18375 [Frankia sp. AgPm24]|uniref:hypothetical protein n=1 Tax=Frankia sp. AgPm24 TaxID=631128 RepID=UPI00200BDD74|nr:hypothetical protein [Frankia sp. AgPm24]MCK9923808.1 hypothetical protein [Frankia sp. AgPm24]
MRVIHYSRTFLLPAALVCLVVLSSPGLSHDTQQLGSYAPTVTSFSTELTVSDGTLQATPVAQSTYARKVFTPQARTFAQSDKNGSLQAAYNYESPGTFSWRYNVNSALCQGGVLVGQAVANIYNNGGLVPATHYSKTGVSPCYGFHASFPGNKKINNKGNYQLSGGLTWKRGNATYNLGFVFNFTITYV